MIAVVLADKQLQGCVFVVVTTPYSVICFHKIQVKFERLVYTNVVESSSTKPFICSFGLREVSKTVKINKVPLIQYNITVYCINKLLISPFQKKDQSVVSTFLCSTHVTDASRCSLRLC